MVTAGLFALHDFRHAIVAIPDRQLTLALEATKRAATAMDDAKGDGKADIKAQYDADTEHEDDDNAAANRGGAEGAEAAEEEAKGQEQAKEEKDADAGAEGRTAATAAAAAAKRVLWDKPVVRLKKLRILAWRSGRRRSGAVAGRAGRATGAATEAAECVVRRAGCTDKRKERWRRGARARVRGAPRCGGTLRESTLVVESGCGRWVFGRPAADGHTLPSCL